MTEEIQKSVVQRAKDLLQMEGGNGNIELVELYDALRTYRLSFHPDRIQAPEQKKAAEDKFKTIQETLADLEHLIEQEKLTRKPQEVAVWNPRYQDILLKSALDRADEEIGRLKQEVEWKENVIASLEREREQKGKEELTKEIEHLESLYKPTKQTFASFGILLALTAALPVLAKVEQVALFLQKYSPCSEATMNGILFAALILVLVSFAKKLWEHDYMKQRSAEVRSPKFAAEFYNFLVAEIGHDEITAFCEYDVVHFLEKKAGRKKKALDLLGFNIFKDASINGLKDIFLNNLLNKKLIHVSKADTLDRLFKIRTDKDY